MGKELYELCPLCGGTGRMKETHYRADGTPIEGCFCKMLGVAPVGLTAGQVERMVERERREQEARANGLRVLTLTLDADDHDAIQAEIARRQAWSRKVDPSGPTLVPEGESDLAGAILAECVRDLEEYRGMFEAREGERS